MKKCEKNNFLTLTKFHRKSPTWSPIKICRTCDSLKLPSAITKPNNVTEEYERLKAILQWVSGSVA